MSLRLTSTGAKPVSRPSLKIEKVDEHIVEFVSDSGEGAQTAGQMFGTVSAQMGNGVWTVEIIPAEIEPPPRSRGGTSGNRIRIAGKPVTNTGETADVVVAFNEQVLYNRISDGALRAGTILLLENTWADSPDETTRKQFAESLVDFERFGYEVIQIPMDVECRKIVPDPRRGKNMWALGMLSAIYDRDLEMVRNLIERRLGKKGEKVVSANHALVQAGYEWAQKNIDFRFEVAVQPSTEGMVVMNGNEALALGIMASGIEVCSMYPITPATSVSHYLAGALSKVGGFVHQAEDEIAAIGFALGASYAGKTSVTVTSGPGLALKTEFIGLAVMAELPLVIIDVQRGSPSTGLPTRVEQADLMAAIYGAPGDAPKIVIAPSTIEECFHFVVTARKLAETFRGPVLILSDANLATGQTSFKRPVVEDEWLAPPVDQSVWDKDVAPYDWDEETGLSQRPIPGQRGGEYVLTGLAHDERSKVAYDSETNQRAMVARSRKLATLQRSLKPPEIHGDEEGDLLIVGWGSTRGAIEEAVDKSRDAGNRVSSLTLRFLSPMEPGLKEIFARFKKVKTIELNYSDALSDPKIRPENRRYSELALLLRAWTLCDVGCWSKVSGVPLPPYEIGKVIQEELDKLDQA